jgi:DNA-binding transcriptional ArsR family regulator
MLDQATATGAETLFKALANPLRLGIVQLLEGHPRCVHELVHELAVPQPLVSQHLRVLRAAHLVATERRGKEVLYSLPDAHVASIANDAIRHVRERSRR